ncbi:MAG: hypothetical protein RLZZ292_812 [Bacteroidota bacterium]|jgi:uncharacterized protein (TIGR00255 family)
MTGFGRASQTYKDKTISVEIRALNSKMLDIRLKTPPNFKEKELELRRILSEQLERGKIDLTISIQSLGESDYGINQTLFKQYYKQITELCTELGIDKGDVVQTILRIPAVIASGETEIDEEEWTTVEAAIKEALRQFHAYRQHEGKPMATALTNSCEQIAENLKAVAPFEQERVTKVRQRMTQSLEEFLGRENVDKNRYEQEVIFYLEKIDISEEKVRLEQNCKHFLEHLRSKKDTVKGRTLNFISQEMGREINTLGAKAYHAEIQKLVVQMKEELEKIKEQLANIV